MRFSLDDLSLLFRGGGGRDMRVRVCGEGEICVYECVYEYVGRWRDLRVRVRVRVCGAGAFHSADRAHTLTLESLDA